MNFLSPDDCTGADNDTNSTRRRSFCNSFFTESIKNSSQSKKNSSKRERRSSLTEPSTSSLRRSSIVQRWFKHISEAAEAYKLRTKGNHDVVPLVDDPATVTISNSSTKESLEPSPEHDLGGSATGSVSDAIAGGHQKNAPRRYGSDVGDNIESIYKNSSSGGKNEENGYSKIDGSGNGAASGNLKTDKSSEYDAEIGGKAQAKIRSDSFSNNNSNSTRTLTQQSSLVAPSEVQISVNPALTAEPVFTPTERLRRLDESIRNTLAEKQKIVCDIYRVPNEHFSAIADIAGQPEAPKEPADIVLAAFAQVQSLTETLNDYIKVSQQQDPSAVSTLLCDDCYTKSQDQQQQSKNQILESKDRLPSSTRGSSVNSSSHSITVPTVIPHKSGGTNASSQSMLPPPSPLDTNDFIQDDDGYCEIDEIRLPAIIKTTPTQAPSTTPALPNPELKRQGTTNTDSIPEETEHEINSEKSSDVADRFENLYVEEPIKSHDDTINDNGSEALDDKSSAATVGNNKCVDETIEFVTSESITQPPSEVNFCMSDADRSTMTHAHAIAPSIPCHLISAYVSALNLQISQLLPKLNERDIEREKLRRENQHLRDLLNSMHERVQVSNDKETPEDSMSSQGPSN